MKILYAVSEAYPFAKDGGLGDVAYGFPQKVKELGVDIHVIMPLYDLIPRQYRDQMELVTNFTLDLGMQTLYCGLYCLIYQGVAYYFVENDIYFARGKIYGCEDDDARFAFFSMAVCQSMHYLGWFPDVVHCNDWQTALIPFYLRQYQLLHPESRAIRTLFTIHNVEYQGDFSYETLTDVFGLSGVLFSEGTMELDGKVNLMKGAVEVADCVTTVSPTYARELKSRDESGALSRVLSRHEIIGIRNGVHKNLNPRANSRVLHPYDMDSLDERAENKRRMQENHGLVVDAEAPVFGCVSRLLRRKGFELLVEVMPRFLADGAQLYITGDGKKEVRKALLELRDQYPKQVDITAYSEYRGTEVYASSDIYLMPSEVEPCGTSQLQAMGYGAVPVVRATGGLKDTVLPYTSGSPEGCGFVFEEYTAEGLRDAMQRALEAYRDKKVWREIQKNCMTQDFSWDEPATAYIDLYGALLDK